MSEEATNVISFMCRELSSCKYGYKSIVEGCYDAAIKGYNMTVPNETKDWIVDKVISILDGV